MLLALGPWLIVNILGTSQWPCVLAEECMTIHQQPVCAECPLCWSILVFKDASSSNFSVLLPTFHQTSCFMEYSLILLWSDGYIELWGKFVKAKDHSRRNWMAFDYNFLLGLRNCFNEIKMEHFGCSKIMTLTWNNNRNI